MQLSFFSGIPDFLSSKDDSDTQNVFLLLSLPFNIPNQRYYPAAYVAGVIKDAGWHCEYIDYNALLFGSSDKRIKDLWSGEYSELIEKSLLESIVSSFVELLKNTLPEKLEGHHVNMVGITTSKYGRYFIDSFMEFYRSLEVQPPIIFGGTDCFPVYYGKKYFNHQLAPDIILQGEAEVSLPKFLNQYEKTQSINTDIPGFVYKDIDKTIVDTGLPEIPLMHECKVVADFSIFDKSWRGYEETATSFTSRGCINKCAFCDAWMSSRVRYRNYEALAKEIKAQVGDRKSQIVSFRDPNLNTSVSHIRDICNSILDEKLDIKWGGMGCFVVDLPDEVIELMKQSGFINFMIGLESASPEVIQLMGKRYDINKAQDMIRRFTRRGIVVQLPLISGFPGETTIDFLTTVAFVLKYKKNSYVRFSFSNRCRLHSKAFINQFPKDFFIDRVTKTPDRWQSSDGLNTFDVRELRSSLLTLLVQDKMIYIRNFKRNIERIDFNKKDVAQEIAELIHRLGLLSNSIEDSLNILECSINEPLLESDGSEARIAVDLSKWYMTDKNGPKKTAIIEYILEKFYSLGALLEQEVFLDIHHFRKKLFCIEKYKKRTDNKGGIEINLVRSTEYDKGRYAVFYGEALNINNVCKVERLFAIAGGHIIEFSCGITVSQENSSNHNRFWGKVKKTYYKNDGITFVVSYDDLTTASFSYSPEHIESLIEEHSENIQENLFGLDSSTLVPKIKLPHFNVQINIHKLCQKQPYISKEINKYKMGEIITFDGTGKGMDFAAWGFSPPANVSWSVSPRAKLQLQIDEIPSASRIEINFDGVTRIAADGSDRDFYEVYVNGLKCATFPITHQKLNSYKVNMEELVFNSGDVINIEFVMSGKDTLSQPGNPVNMPRIGLKSLVADFVI